MQVISRSNILKVVSYFSSHLLIQNLYYIETKFKREFQVTFLSREMPSKPVQVIKTNIFGSSVNYG